MSGIHLPIPTDKEERKRLIAAHFAAEQFHAAMGRALTYEDDISEIQATPSVGLDKGAAAYWRSKRDRFLAEAIEYLQKMPIIWTSGFGVTNKRPMSAAETVAKDRGLTVVK